MTGYERDFIYKTIPDLSRSIEKLSDSIKERTDDNDFDTLKRIFSSTGLAYKVDPKDDKYVLSVQTSDVGREVIYEFDLNKKLIQLYI